MKAIAVILLIVSVIFFWGTFKYFLDLKRPGVYPPKQLLKQRAAALASLGGACLLIALLLSYLG
ncbi:hypothetical protein [Neobacillus fumarioli]|uniref:hypothetical protein n=1 Tax=Neobacillus fumarioli TaxID=105229 RepID=UPI00082AE2BA|nr:hypothetical protein [Neobacillus fumarioli]